MTRSFARAFLLAGSIGTLASLPVGSVGAQDKPKEDRNSVPQAAKPPAGMCRVWLDGVTAAQQPASTDCATAIKNMPRNAKIMFGDLSGGDPFRPLRTTTRTSISNNSSAWPREWARDPIALRSPTSVDPFNGSRYRAAAPSAASTATGVQAIRTTQSAIVAQPAAPPASKPPEKP